MSGTPQLWLEDMPVGRRFSFGDSQVVREEVIDFATRYDPQPFHIDDAAAAANPLFGRISASGLHTMALANILTHNGYIDVGLIPLGGGGLDELRFLKPVFPGDTLRVEQEVIESRPLASRPERGLLRFLTTVFNQNDEAVMSHKAILFVATRPSAAAD